jgi:pantoate--beta-alanine ligase
MEAMRPETLRTVASLREAVAAWRRDGASVGMVPTMGALHAGHLALVREAQRRCDRVVVTLFVNPAQFAPTEDLAAYPRTEASDREKLAALGADVLFAPSAADMYPAGFATRIEVGGPAAGLETDFRPHFFSGVATIVAKLLLAGLPDRAYFGEKDYQQLLVVKQLVGDLNIPTEIVGCPTVREADGLALSSRNAYLSPEERALAPKLYETLQATARRLSAGTAIDMALSEGRAAFADAGFAVDYLELRNAGTLAPVRDAGTEPLRLLAAARLGRTRLIDNIAVS